jgi:hypothetical protein
MQYIYLFASQKAEALVSLASLLVLVRTEIVKL